MWFWHMKITYNVFVREMEEKGQIEIITWFN